MRSLAPELHRHLLEITRARGQHILRRRRRRLERLALRAQRLGTLVRLRRVTGAPALGGACRLQIGAKSLGGVLRGRSRRLPTRELVGALRHLHIDRPAQARLGLARLVNLAVQRAHLRRVCGHHLGHTGLGLAHTLRKVLLQGHPLARVPVRSVRQRRRHLLLVKRGLGRARHVGLRRGGLGGGLCQRLCELVRLGGCTLLDLGNGTRDALLGGGHRRRRGRRRRLRLEHRILLALLCVARLQNRGLRPRARLVQIESCLCLHSLQLGPHCAEGFLKAERHLRHLLLMLRNQRTLVLTALLLAAPLGLAPVHRLFSELGQGRRVQIERLLRRSQRRLRAPRVRVGLAQLVAQQPGLCLCPHVTFGEGR